MSAVLLSQSSAWNSTTFESTSDRPAARLIYVGMITRCLDRVKKLVVVNHDPNRRTDHCSHCSNGLHIHFKIAFAEFDLDRSEAAFDGA